MADGALLSLAGPVAEVDLLAWATSDALTPAATLVLVDRHDAVFGPRVDCTEGARRHAGGVHAVLAHARQAEHEGLLECEFDLVFGFATYLFDDLNEMALLWRAGKIVVPVRRPGDLRVLAGEQRFRPGDEKVIPERCIDEGFVVLRPGFLVVFNLGLRPAREQSEQLGDPTAAGQRRPILWLSFQTPRDFAGRSPVSQCAEVVFDIQYERGRPSVCWAT